MGLTAITGGLVLALDERGSVFPGGTVVVEDSHIVAVGHPGTVATPPGAEVIDATGCSVLPGFINAHTHVSQVLLRGGISHSRVLYDWLTNIVLPGLKVYTDDDLRIAVRLYCAEAVRAGVTTIVANEEPDARDPEGMAAIALDVFAEVGLRVVYAWMYRDQAPDVVWQGVPAERERDLPTVTSLGPTFHAIERLHRRYRTRTDGRVQVWPSPATTAVMSAAGLRESTSLAGRLGTGWALHLAETTTEAELRGISPVRYLESIHCLDSRLLAGHCVHVDAGDIRLLARAGASVSTQPVSNCYLGSGIAPVPAMLAAGLTVALGTDDANCNDAVNPLADMKTLALLHRGVARDPKVLPPERILRMATSDAAKALHFDDIGSLAPGKRADIITLRLDQPHLVPFHSPLAALVFQANGSEVDTVLVDGRPLMRRRKLTFVDDLESFCAAAQAASAEVLQRSGLVPAPATRP